MIPNNHGGAISDDGDDGGASGSMLKKGPWTAAEDAILMEYVKKHGEGNWNAVQRNSGLSRCGKSCRLRWANHLRPNLKKGSFSPDEERFILELHSKLGNKWARMAAQLPGRTDNEIKNYWNTRVKRRQRAGLPLYPQEIQKQATGFHLHHQRHLCPPSPPPPTQHPNPNFGSSLSLFDAINFSAATPIRGQYMAPSFPSPIHHRFKRFRDHNSVGLSLPLSTPPPPLPSPLLTQTLPSQFPFQPSLPFNSGNFDFNPPYMSTPFEPDGALPLGSVFSKKLELPSNQISEPAPIHAATSAFTNDYEISHPLSRSNSGLLDALLQEAQSMAGNENSKREGPLTTEEENPTLDGFVDNSMPSAIFSERCTTPPLRSGSLWDDSISVHSFVGAKRKRESLNEINSVDDEFSGLLDIIPSTASVSEWYSDSGEMSNGQSSAVTDDDIGLHVHQLAPSLSAVTTSDHDWILDSCSWDNMPGIC